MLRFFFLAVIVVISIQTASAQSEDGAWVVVDSELVVDVLNETLPHMPVLSPDGSAIAYEQRRDGVCIHRFADNETTCVQWPEGSELSTSRVNQPVWSPDGTQIAYTPNFFQLFHESDLWTLDVITGEFTNQTDDQTGEPFFPSGDADGPPQDYLPVWHPITGELFFFRSRRIATIGNSVGYSTELHKVNQSGQSKLVHQLTHLVPGPFAVFRPPAFSEDGSMLAFIAIPANSAEEPRSGIWTLAIGTGELTQVADLEAFTVGLPGGIDYPLMPQDVYWAGDDLVTLAVDFRQAAVTIPYHIDLESGVVTPLRDFSDFETIEALEERRAEGLSEFSTMVQGVPSPDGQMFLAYLVSRDTEEAGLFAFPFPPSSQPPELLKTGEFAPLPGAEATPLFARDGKTLLHNTLFTLEREQ